MVTKVATITLPGTTDPYNNVEYLELRLGDLDAKLVTNCEWSFVLLCVCVGGGGVLCACACMRAYVCAYMLQLLVSVTLYPLELYSTK